MTSDDQRQTDSESPFDESLREELGLPPLRCEPNAPPLNVALIRALATDNLIDEAEQKMVMNYLDRFQEWRDAYTQIVIDNYNRQLQRRPNDDTPAPGSP